MKKYKIAIPKPCHKDWKTMTPLDKGRFCKSCAKTVVDFTKKTSEEIYDFFKLQENEKVCGRFYKKQLDSIVIQIPESIFNNNLSFKQLFLLALLFVMGTALFSCKSDVVTKQKIEKIELIDSLVRIEQVIDTLENNKLEESSLITKKDTVVIKNKKKNVQKPPIPHETLEGKLETGEPIYIEEVIEETIEECYPEAVGGILFRDVKPKFSDCENLSNIESTNCFNKKISDFIKDDFKFDDIDSKFNLDPGIYKVLVNFKINKEGEVSDIIVETPHKKLKNKIIKTLTKLPKFVPGESRGKKISLDYSLPLTFELR